MISVTEHIALDDAEIEETFLRASGAGGQNVNKVETAVQLRFDARNSPNLPERIRERVIRLAGRRATRDGVIVLIARRHRTQQRNRDDARERLVALIRRAAAPPPPPRRRTRPTRAATEKRLETKAIRSGVKRLRERPAPD